MYIYNSNFSVNKSINNVFNLIYEVTDNKEKSLEDNINDNLYKIIEWNINNWCINKGKLNKIENIYIYVNDLPDYLKELLIENDNYIRFRRKHIIVNNGEKYKEIITKNNITNLKKYYSILFKTLNSLKLIKIKEKIVLTYLSDNETNIDIRIKVKILIKTNTDSLEKYLAHIFEIIINNIKIKFYCRYYISLIYRTTIVIFATIVNV